MTEVDAQTIRDATEARIEAEEAREEAQQAQWDAEAARAGHQELLDRQAALEERLVDVEAVTLGVVAYLAEEEEQEQQQPAEPEHTEVEQRPESKPEDREPEPEHDDHRACGSLW